MESDSLTETKFILKSLVRSCPCEITIDKLNKDYTNTMGYQIPFRKFGFRTIEQFLYSIPDTLRVTDGRNPLVYVASSEKTYHIEKMISVKKNFNKVKRKDFLSTPLHKHNRLATNVMQNAYNMHSIPANSNILQKPLRNNVDVEPEYSTQCNTEMCEPPQSYLCPASDELNFKQEAVPDFNEDDAIFLLDFPANTVKFSDKIKSFELPKDLKTGDVFPLFVTEIHNPYKFWFHIAKHNNELDELMQGLQEFFENSEHQLVMQVSNIVPGQICAAPYSRLWHRAEILSIPNDGNVKVCFIDYGTVFNIPATSIQYLPMEFSKLNKQALRGSLSHIKPLGVRWSRDATYSFLDAVADKLLYGKVTEIVTDDKIVRLILTDTNQDKDFQINNALILKGHAIFAKSCTLFDKFYYPTFEMLENGEYPTFDEIGKLLARGMDYEANVDSNIISDVFTSKCSLEEYLQKLTSYHIKRIN